LALFDELNIVGVKKHVHKLYKSIYKTVKQEFLKISLGKRILRAETAAVNALSVLGYLIEK
jgi:hypothetical protein